MTNQKLSKALCIAAAAFLACGSGAAYAQKGSMFTSQGGWVTKDLASSKKGALPYCVAAKKFSKNTILTVAENKSGEISFAFDFGSGYFDPSVTAHVLLDPGAGQQRAFKVKPRSSKAIVVKLGQDGAFFDALQRTGLLRMEIQDQSLNFNLSDIDVGREKLSECLDGVIVVSAPKAVPPGTQGLSSINVEDGKLYEDMQSAYEHKIKMLEAKLAKSEPELEKLAPPALMEPPKMVQVETDRVPQALPQPGEVLPQRLPGLNDTAADIADKLAAAPTAVTKSYTKSDREKYEALRAEYGQTKASLISYQEKVSLLRARIDKLEAEKSLAVAAQNVNSDKVAQEQIEGTKQKELAKALLVENEALKAQVANLEGRYAQESQKSELRYQALEKSYVQAQANLTAADKDLAGLKADLLKSAAVEQTAAIAPLNPKEVEGQFAGLLKEKEKVIALEAERDVLAAKVNELEFDYKRQTSRVNDDYAALRKTHDIALSDLDRVNKEADALRAKVTQAEALQKQMETASLSEAQKLEADFKDLLSEKDVTSFVDAENVALKNKVQSLEEGLAHQISSGDERYKQLQDRHDEAKADLMKMTQSVAALKVELAQAEVVKQKALAMQAAAIEGNKGANNEAVVAAKRQVLSLEAENTSLRAEMDALKSSHDKELSALKSGAADRSAELRRQELEVAALRAEAERQLAEARATKVARLEQSKRNVRASSEVPSVASSVASTVGNVVSSGAAVVSGAARAGASAASRLVDAPLPSLNDVSVPKVAARAVDVTDAQRMEQDILKGLKRRQVAESVAAAEPIRVSYDDIPLPENIPARVDMVETIKPPVREQAVKSVAVSYASPAIGMMLQNAQVPVASNVSYVDAVSTPVYQAYEWRAGQVFGSAEQHDGAKDADFDRQVLSYLENTQKRCTGDFAIEPASSRGDGSDRVDSYEVACVGANVSSAAAIVFYKDAGKFTAVAHEASVENMSAAMSLRDRVVQALVGRKSG